MRWRPMGLAMLLLSNGVMALPDAIGAASCDPAESAISRTDHRADGNRLAAGQGLIGSRLDVQLDGVPVWVLAHPGGADLGWIVVLDDGAVVKADPSAQGVVVERLDVELRATDIPPLVTLVADCGITIEDGHGAQLTFQDARLVSGPGGLVAALTGPTQRYPHGVLGDAIEASAVSLAHVDGSRLRIAVADTEVIEGTAPMLADMTGDGVPEVLVTVSDEDGGARLRVYGSDGGVVAESDAIGRGFWWRHQIGVARLGRDRVSELVVVRTPHIGGVVEAFRLVGDRLELAASEPGFSSHRLGSRNLDMALLADVDGDGRPDVIVPTQDMRWLAVLGRSAAGFEDLGRLPLGGALVTNVAATTDADGRLVLAAGTDDGRLRIFR